MIDWSWGHTLSKKKSKFSRYNKKCSGKRYITRNIPCCTVFRFPATFQVISRKMDYLWDSVYSSAVLVQTYQPFYPRIWALFDRSIFPMRGIEVERQRKREEGRDKEWWWEKHRFVKSEELRYRNYCNAGLQETCMRFQARLTRPYTGPLKRPSTGPSHRTLQRTLHTRRSSHRPLQRPLHGMGLQMGFHTGLYASLHIFT